MKKVFAIVITLIAMSFHMAGAQQETPVAPGLNTLYNAILAAGEGDVLVLERGENALYLYQETAQINVALTIKAADGDGALPVIRPTLNPSGAWAGNPLQLYANVTLVNLYFNGIREDTDRANRTGSVFNMAADNLRVVIDGCTFVGYGGRTLEPGRDGATLIVRNSTETGNGRSNRVDNGRFIDVRDALIDTLILQNNTLLNCADRWYRHMNLDSGADYVLMDHNTFMNGTGYRPCFQFRNVRELYFINNLVINPSILGTTTAGNRLRNSETQYNDYDGTATFTHAGADTSNEVMVFRNNNVWSDPRIDAILGGLDEANGDSVEIAPWFNPEVETRIDPSAAFFSEELTFGHAPTIDSVLTELELYVSGAGGYSHTAFIFRTDEYAEGLDMSYGTTAQSYTAGAAGFPLGDLNWYPDKKAEWLEAGWEGQPTSVGATRAALPARFALAQNYPNPFNPETKIEFSLDQATDVSIGVYNLLGEKVRSLLETRQQPGTHHVIWDGKNELGAPMPSGIYFYRLFTGTQTLTKKMTLMR
jgi:hypothetical protein